MGGKKKIPEGWLQYSPLGNPIPGTVIICFKVPLKPELCRSIPDSDWFTPSMLISKVPNLAGIIDVTNTPHYYDNWVILEKGILHEKIQCPGHVVPPAHVVESFQKVMQRMWTTAESGGKLVGVHCTHGINRTGYLVCRYLIECRGFQPEDAIRLFGESRGHGIERQNYLSDLRTLKPSHHSPNAIPHADFLKMEEQRRAYWNTDATIDSLRPRHNRHANMRHSSFLPSANRPRWALHNGQQPDRTDSQWRHNGQQSYHTDSQWHHNGPPSHVWRGDRVPQWHHPPSSQNMGDSTYAAGHHEHYHGHHHHHHRHGYDDNWRRDHRSSSGGRYSEGSRYASGHR